MTAHAFPSQDEKGSTISHSSSALLSAHLGQDLNSMHIHPSNIRLMSVLAHMHLVSPTTSNYAKPCSLESAVG